MPAFRKLPKADLDNLVRQIVDLTSPVSIFLFGSATDDDLLPKNDIDVLIVLPDGSPVRRQAHLLNRKVERNGYSIDFVVVSEQEFATQRENHWSVVHTAVQQGERLYAA